METILWVVGLALAGLGAWVIYRFVKKRGEAVVDAATGKKKDAPTV